MSKEWKWDYRVNIGNNKGIALVITLLVLTLLIVMILEFNSGMRIEARAAANFRDEMKAYYLAKSGVTFAIEILEEDRRTQPGYDSLDELWAQKFPPIPLGDGFVSVEITDENSKINVTKLGSRSDNEWHELMRSFLEQRGLKEEIVNAVSDWIDQDKEERSNGGAESNYYEGLEDPYEAKDGVPDSLQELRLVKDMDNDTFSQIQNFITVHSNGLININTANKEVLLALPSDLDAEYIIASRAETPFQSKQDATNRILDPSVRTGIERFITVKSDYFSITSTGEVNQSRKKINAIVKRDAQNTKILYWRVE